MDLSETPEKFQEYVNDQIHRYNEIFKDNGNLIHVEVYGYTDAYVKCKAFIEYSGSILILSHAVGSDRFEKDLVGFADVDVIVKKSSAWKK